MRRKPQVSPWQHEVMDFIKNNQPLRQTPRRHLPSSAEEAADTE